MSVHFISSSLVYFTINIFFFLLSTIKTSYSLSDEQLKECRLPYGCGRIQGIRYPFWGDDRPEFCGHPGFELKCVTVKLNDDTGEEQFMFDYNSQRFRVLEINSTQETITMARNDLWETTCLEEFVNTTLNFTLFGFIAEVRKLSIFYDCNTSQTSMSIRNNFTCSGNTTAVYADESFAGIGNLNYTEARCRVGIQVPVLRTALDKLVTRENPMLQETVNQGFTVRYIAACLNCSSRTLCGSNSTLQQFVCHSGQPPGSGPNVRRKLIIGFGSAGISILAMTLIFFIYQRRNKRRYASSFYLSRNMSYNPSSITDLEKMDSKYFGVHIFSYSELEEATNKFDSARELGDGGFGTVYYGKLRDGRVVAVKRLYENNYKRVEQFMNEVEILTRLRHPYLVSLYGCTSRHSRELLLVYEYVPNGTVADHLHGERAKPGSLPWSTRVSIAIETATALTYLHASDIIHRDVKTNNILLDNNFYVKVADFGLSRLFPTDVTHVSTAPQGTPGYVDPDYHQCYQLTVKSDVFSFGVVLIELISSKPAVDITRHRHEINLSNMAINRIKNHALHELVDPCLGFESDCKVREMIIAVAELAFECLQNEKEMRPSMEQVLERLKDIQIEVYNVGKAEVMDIPAEDIVLLKSCHLLPSPDSGTTSSC